MTTSQTVIVVICFQNYRYLRCHTADLAESLICIELRGDFRIEKLPLFLILRFLDLRF